MMPWRGSQLGSQTDARSVLVSGVVKCLFRNRKSGFGGLGLVALR
jgi:hypothetical protein